MNFLLDNIETEMLIQNLRLKNSETNNDSYHMFSICIVRSKVSFDISYAFLKVILPLAALVLLLVSFCIMCAIFKTSHTLIKPLRNLNSKMQEVMIGQENDNMAKHGLTAGKNTSQEISELYDVFTDLIQDRQFSQN